MTEHVLLVDDDDRQRKLCTLLLEEVGYRVEAVACADDALHAARRACPDIIVSDVVMPDLDGFGLCRKLHDDPALASIPVVLLSAHYGGIENKELAQQVGAAALVERTPGFTRELAVIERCLDAGAPAIAPVAAYEEHLKSTANQLVKVVAQTRRAEQRLSALAEQAHDVISLLSVDGIILEANQRWDDLLGIPAAQMIGHHIRDFAAAGEADKSVADYTRVVANRAGYVVAALRHGITSATVYVEFSARVLDVDGTPRVLSIGRDVTDKFEAARHAAAAESERRTLEARLAHAQKLDALGRLTGGIAHDFNNVLAVIMTYANLLSEDLADNDPRREDVLEIAAAGERAAALTRQLLAFSRRQVLEFTDIDVSVTVSNLARMLQRLIGEDIDLAIAHADVPVFTRADASQLEQVIVNLVVNARDAMSTGGTITVTTSCVESAGTDVAPGSYVMIEVADTGSGIDDDTRRQMFEPFFTTKPQGRGTGLGLSTSYGIVQQCGGAIVVESELGVGTKMKVLLPRADHVVAPATCASRTAARGSETILVIEDDPAVRGALHRALVDRGFDVVTAGDLDTALAAVRAHPRRVQLIISDVVLPRASGPEVVARMIAEAPQARVLYISGYVDVGLDEGRALLHKPFTPDALASKVREVLATEVPCAS